MRFEVDLIEEEGGVFKASAVAYPTVTATGRTEKEALGLLMEAMDRYMKAQGKERGSA
jgi:predicted RNase H-like HicB family nuclease